MKKTMLLAAAAILTLQAVPAFAEHDGTKHGNRGDKMFEKFDTNKDGSISAQESADAAKKKFDEMDADKNGSVTKDEAKAHHEAKKAEWEKKKAEMKAKGEMPADVPADAPKAE